MFLRGYCLACFRLLNVVANVVSVGFFGFFLVFFCLKETAPLSWKRWVINFSQVKSDLTTCSHKFYLTCKTWGLFERNRIFAWA